LRERADQVFVARVPDRKRFRETAMSVSGAPNWE